MKNDNKNIPWFLFPNLSIIEMVVFEAIIVLIIIMNSTHALTIPNGECQSFILFNETDNSTLNESICAGNSTIIYNITNVTNVTVVNVTNVTNITVLAGCNSTNITMWANSTATVNNATIACLGNLTTIQNITVVNATIPINYCYQNVNNLMGYSGVYRSDVCNITIISPPNISVAGCLPYQYYVPCPVCTACAACAECPAQRECAAPRVCEPSFIGELRECNNTLLLSLAELNTTKEDYAHQIEARNEIIEGQKQALTTIDGTVDKKVEEKTGNVNDMYAYALVAGLCCTIFFVYKSRQPSVTAMTGISEAITKERLDRLRAKRGGDLSGRTTDDAGAVEKGKS
jgi:hypothetical protein